MNFFQLMFGEWLELLFGFRGRINRAKYWLTFLIYFVALFALYIRFGLFFSFPTDPVGIILTFAIPFIPIVISSVALAIKRLHDRNKSGWWLLVFYLLPGVIDNIGMYTAVQLVFHLASLALSIWALVELGFLRGTSGSNKYGPDPLAPKKVRPGAGKDLGHQSMSVRRSKWKCLEATITAGAVLFPAVVVGSVAWAQASTNSSSEVAINLGGRGWSAPNSSADENKRPADQFEFDVRGGFATDYMYRGTTLSDHKPAVGAAFEASFAHFYAGVAVASVKLPTQPSAEISMSAGVRKTIADINFDLGATYFLYPGETSVGAGEGIDYWEAAIRAEKQIAQFVRVVGGFAFAPNVSNTGAWGSYAAGGVGIEVPSRFLPPDIAVSFTGGGGYSWFGNQSPEFGGFPLPAYLNWQFGVTFTRKVFNLDLRYYDTNLSRENCFVLTGDPNARPGGAINPLTNPEGLTSNWCSATFVAKFSFALN